MKKFTIIANPVSGVLSADDKRRILQPAADILDADIAGLDTSSPDEFFACAREAASHGGCLVAAGGDGTFSGIINAVDLSCATLAFLPMGSGNALRHTLNYPRSLKKIAERIRRGTAHEFDLIGIRDRVAFMSGIGLDGELIRKSAEYRAAGHIGFFAYCRAAISAYKQYVRANADITLDGHTVSVRRLLSFIVVKQPYCGYGLNIVPHARFDDGALHTLAVTSGAPGALAGIAMGLTVGNRIGQYRTAKTITIKTDRPLWLQLDGDIAWESDCFEFRLLPGTMKLIC